MLVVTEKNLNPMLRVSENHFWRDGLYCDKIYCTKVNILGVGRWLGGGGTTSVYTLNRGKQVETGGFLGLVA